MTISKITNAPTQNGIINKINEIIDNLGGGGTVDQTFDPTSVNAQSGAAINGALGVAYPVIDANINNGYFYLVFAPDSTGYRFCIQGTFYYQGSTLAATDNPITFVKEFKDLNYIFIPSIMHSNANISSYAIYEKSTLRTTSSTVLRTVSADFGYTWVAMGYIKNGV